MDKKDLQLIFVTKVGEMYDEGDVYEFIFSDNAALAIGYNWEKPCQYNVEPPQQEYAQLVARLSGEGLQLTLLEEMYEFRYLDGVNHFIALAWEYVDDYQTLDDLNQTLLSFHYGETYAQVQRKLADRSLSLEA
jgi:hypothetical protein